MLGVFELVEHSLLLFLFSEQQLGLSNDVQSLGRSCLPVQGPFHCHSQPTSTLRRP